MTSLIPTLRQMSQQLDACELRPVAALSWVRQVESKIVALGGKSNQVATLCSFRP